MTFMQTKKICFILLLIPTALAIFASIALAAKAAKATVVLPSPFIDINNNGTYEKSEDIGKDSLVSNVDILEIINKNGGFDTSVAYPLDGYVPPAQPVTLIILKEVKFSKKALDYLSLVASNHLYFYPKVSLIGAVELRATGNVYM